MFSLFQKNKSQKKLIRHLTVAWIDRDKCTLISYPDNLVKLYQYPASCVLDGDVLNREEFREGFTKWIQESTLKPTEIVYVISPSLSFERTITTQEKSSEASITSSFVDSVPFQKITTARIIIGGNTHIIVTNKELVNSVSYAFELLGFVNLAVFPYKAIGNKPITTTANPLNDLIELGKLFINLADMKNHDAFEFGLDTVKPVVRPMTTMTVAEAAQQPVNPMIAVVAVLFMVSIGGGIMYWRFSQVYKAQADTVKRLNQGRLINTSATSTTETPTIQPSSDSTATSSASLTTTPAPTTKKQIQIIYTSKTELQYREIKADIDRDQVMEVVGKLSNDTSTQKNLIILSDGVTTQEQARLSDALKTAGVRIEAKTGKVTDYVAVIQLVEAP